MFVSQFPLIFFFYLCSLKRMRENILDKNKGGKGKEKVLGKKRERKLLKKVQKEETKVIIERKEKNKERKKKWFYYRNK